MLIKVCGICNTQNGLDVCRLRVDMIGFNFYPKSVRYVSAQSLVRFNEFSRLKVGIFVNEDLAVIETLIRQASLDFVQMHGNESPEDVKRIAAFKPVIQAMPANRKTLTEEWKKYPESTYFLFDTPTLGFGGSGNKFDWTLLEEYKGDIPFFLSGGIGPEDINIIRRIQHPSFAGIDLNSRFELTAGIKDVALLSQFIESLKI